MPKNKIANLSNFNKSLNFKTYSNNFVEKLKNDLNSPKQESYSYRFDKFKSSKVKYLKPIHFSKINESGKANIIKDNT